MLCEALLYDHTKETQTKQCWANKKMQSPLNNWSFKFILFASSDTRHVWTIFWAAMALDLHDVSASFFLNPIAR